MAKLEGWRGSVALAGSKIGEITHWTATFGARDEESQALGTDHVERTYTIKDVTGSFEGNYDKSDASQTALINQFLNGGTPAAVWLYLYVSGSEGYYGQANVDVTTDDAVDSLQNISVSFREADEWYENIT